MFFSMPFSVCLRGISWWTFSSNKGICPVQHSSFPASILSCIRSVLHPSWPAYDLSCIQPALHQPCILRVLYLICPSSDLSCIHPAAAYDLSYIWPVLHLTCPASDLSCIWSVLHPSGPASICRFDDERRLHINNFIESFLPELYILPV